MQALLTPEAEVQPLRGDLGALRLVVMAVVARLLRPAVLQAVEGEVNQIYPQPEQAAVVEAALRHGMHPRPVGGIEETVLVAVLGVLAEMRATPVLVQVIPVAQGLMQPTTALP